MTLYNYVAERGDLEVLIVEAVLAEAWFRTITGEVFG